MRSLTAFAASAVLALAVPAAAQTPDAQPPAGAEQTPNGSLATRIRKVEIVDLVSLPPTTQSQVATEIAKTSDEELEALRRTIDTLPQASSALKAKGLDTSKVVLASLDDDGTLLLITRTAGG